MPHNPVMERRTCSRSLLRSRVEIPIGTVGVLYDGGRYIRTLEPGGSLSLRERSKTLTLHVVDIQPHTAIWSVHLPTRDDEDFFPINITVEYQVVDPQGMVEKRIQDTERLLSRTLEPALRRESRRFGLNRHREAEIVLEDISRGFDLGNVGLQIVRVDVAMDLDALARERIRQLDDLERAIRVPQLSEHTARLPTKEPTYEFETRVVVTYRVTERDRLPTRTLDEAEVWLWQQVQRALRRVSRRYSTDQVGQAEEAMQEAIELEHFSDYGLEVVSALVEISLDERALERARALTEIYTAEEFEMARASLQDWQEKRKLDQQRDAIEFYGPLIKEGQWNLLAMILSQDTSSAERILEYLDGQRREILANRIEVFKNVVEAGALEGWQMEEPAKAVLQSVLNQVMMPPSSLGLPDKPSHQHLDTGEGEVDTAADEPDEVQPTAQDSPPNIGDEGESADAPDDDE